MLPIPAKTVYIAPDVYTKENCRERLERLLLHIVCDDIRDYDAAAREAIGQNSKRRHGKDDFGDDAILIFTTFDPQRSSWYYHYRDKRQQGQAHGGFCQSALELNVVDGCVYRCAYCGFGRQIRFSLDVERLVEGLDDVFAKYPDQALYKYSNMTDLPPFEPELNAISPLVGRFAQESGRYLMLFTKSDQVDFLADLPHNGHTIISWSLTCETASRAVDKRTASLSERLEAMRRMQEAGYRVRARLSPIVPVRNWKQEYEELFQKLFETVSPDIITLELLGWFEYADLTELMDLELLDPDALAEAEGAQDELRDFYWGPFTERLHQEVYRFCIETSKRLSKHTPISLCHGTQAAWRSLGGLMGMQPTNYICNCGPSSAPGNPLYDQAQTLLAGM